jgi:hypothetical protein
LSPTFTIPRSIRPVTTVPRPEIEGVGLNREELYFLAGLFLHVLQEAVPYLGVDGWILDRRIGKDQRRGVGQLAGVRGNVGYQVAVGVLISAVQFELRLGHNGGGEQHRGCGEQYLHEFLPIGCNADRVWSGAAAMVRSFVASAGNVHPKFDNRQSIFGRVSLQGPTFPDAGANDPSTRDMHLLSATSFLRKHETGANGT